MSTDTSEWWDKLKLDIVKTTLRTIRERRRMCRNSLRQKLARLVKQQQRLVDQQAGVAATVESITDELGDLTLDETAGPSRAARLRRAIADCKRDRAALNQKHLFAANTYVDGKTTRRFFRRVSDKFGDNTIRRLDPVPGCPVRPVHDKADTLADAWTPILQQEPAEANVQDEVVNWVDKVTTPTPLQVAVAASITEDEVIRALQECHEGKASGPDRLGNSWYREYASDLAPILTTLLSSWYTAGVFPASFLDADIFCLKKSGNTSNALNFRPLALLNTDYKLLTRILATRVSKTLPERIHPTQNGFVPGRTIHDTLHIYEAVQKFVSDDPDQSEALVLLLDFMKAYDSLSRSFLVKILRQHGYPDQFIDTVEKLHAGTRVRFLANGYRSREVEVTSGIRQGCPLAPLLFILALDAYYREIDRNPGLQGVVLKSAAGATEVRLAGYADDTAIYLRSPHLVPELLRITDVFGQASGLKLNQSKTLVIALHPDGPKPGVTLPDPLHFQAVDERNRYLGIQVGSKPDPDHTWRVAEQQLQTRLSLACLKTCTVDQRSLVAGAVIIPKLMFIGRHAWPSAMMMNRLARKIKNYVWHATFTAETTGSRAWLDADLAALPRSDGGLAIPDLRVELMAMAAVVVQRWAIEGRINS